MHISMESQRYLQQAIARESSQVVVKVKLESGLLENKPKSWKPAWKSIVAEYGQFKWNTTMSKLWVPVQMARASFGIWKHLQELCVSLSLHFSSKFSTIQMNHNFSQLDLTERLLIGKLSMDKQSECWMGQKKEKSMH